MLISNVTNADKGQEATQEFLVEFLASQGPSLRCVHPFCQPDYLFVPTITKAKEKKIGSDEGSLAINFAISSSPSG